MDKARFEHIKMIYDVESMLSRNDISPKRRADLKRYRRRLQKELEAYDRYRGGGNE